MLIQEIHYEFIYDVWSQFLWPNRKSKIQPTSSMTLDGNYDVSIHRRYTPFFWGAFENGKLAGVNSGHKTDEFEFRSRGLYVFPNYRKKGIGRALLLTACEAAILKNCKVIWSAPRLSSSQVYERAGFRLTTKKLSNEHGFEFGPNLYAQKELPSA